MLAGSRHLSAPPPDRSPVNILFQQKFKSSNRIAFEPGTQNICPSIFGGYMVLLLSFLITIKELLHLSYVVNVFRDSALTPSTDRTIIIRRFGSITYSGKMGILLQIMSSTYPGLHNRL